MLLELCKIRICVSRFRNRYLIDIGEKILKPDYHHDRNNTTYYVLLIPEKIIVDNILGSYKNLGNPASSRRQLINVWIRLIRTLLR